MKINYIIWNLKCTGGVRVYFEVVNELIKRGHKVTVNSIVGDSRWFPLKAKVTKPKADIDYKNYLGMFKAINELAKVIPDCDINVAGWPFSVYSMRLSNKGKVKFHSSLHFERMFFKGVSKLAVDTAYKFPVENIVNSIWLQRKLKEQYSLDSYLVNPAIDHKTFKPKKTRKVKNRIVCLGKDDVRWKGVPEALKAMKMVMKKKKNVELVFFGLKPLSIKTSVPYKFVKFPSDSELATLYNSANIVLCPSWYESFPLPPLEAMACGTPVVTTRLGTEDYAFDGKNSLVVQPRKPKLIADAILELLDDKSMQERFRKEGLKTAKEFTYVNTVNRLEKIFKDSLNRN